MPVRGWGAGGVAGGPSQRGMCAFISRAPYSLPQPLGHGPESSCVRCLPNVQTRTWHGPQWPRQCVSDSGGIVGLDVGSEAGAISPEISPAWAVYMAGGISTSAIINSIPDVRSAAFKGVRPSGGPNQVWREAAAHQRAGGRAIGIGGAVTCSPLPHHRTSGSASGGSRS